MSIWEINYTIKDSKREKSILTVYMSDNAISAYEPYPAGLEGTQVIDDFAQQLAIFLDGLIDGKIAKIRIGRQVALPAGIKAAAAGNSDVEQGVVVTWICTGGIRYKQRIATLKEEFIYDEGIFDPFVIEGTDGVNWYSMMTNPVETSGDWIIHPTDARGTDIVSMAVAIEKFKKSRK